MDPLSLQGSQVSNLSPSSLERQLTLLSTLLSLNGQLGPVAWLCNSETLCADPALQEVHQSPPCATTSMLATKARKSACSVATADDKSTDTVTNVMQQDDKSTVFHAYPRH
jgi:hypothetical protein